MSENKQSAAQDGPSSSEAWSPAQLSQALKDLARGEQTANALESNLSRLESKLDELLASFEDSLEQAAEGKDPDASNPANTTKAPDVDAEDSERKTTK